GPPEKLFKTPIPVGTMYRSFYEVSRDARRFLLAVPMEEDRLSRLGVTLNWMQALER
ncbi:MAG: hypothetical protein HY821_06830, partial [Acidobacteria bacterium]|nr:hypothetical protein [Acidobacteriota bacterium]